MTALNLARPDDLDRITRLVGDFHTEQGITQDDATRRAAILPLDVTHKALVTQPRNDAFRALGTPVGIAVAQMTEFFERYDREKYGSDGAPLHDPCVTAYLIRPDLFTGRHVNVQVETTSELTMGMTVADWWGVTDRAPNAYFIGDLDADGFFSLLTERLARL